MNKRDPEHTRRLQKLHQQQTHSRIPRVWINKGCMAPSYCTSLIPMYYILYLAVVVPLAAEVMLSMMQRWHSQDLLPLFFLSSEFSPAFLRCNGTQHHQPSQWITSYKNKSNFSNHSGWTMSRRARGLGCLPWWWGRWRSRWRGWARAWCSPWRCGAPSRWSYVGAYTMLNLLSSDFWT